MDGAQRARRGGTSPIIQVRRLVMAAQPQTEVSPSRKDLTGTLKTFGTSGPMYEVLGPAERSVQGKESVTIRVFGTGEVTAYPVEEMLQDPEAV